MLGFTIFEERDDDPHRCKNCGMDMDVHTWVELEDLGEQLVCPPR
jgi:hypothetical protein